MVVIPKQLVTFQELLLSQVLTQEALTRLLVAKGNITTGGFGNGEGG
jgi:hypothetical protein